MAGLNEDVWLSEVKLRFRMDKRWLLRCQDLSMYVNYDVINLAAAGVDPQIVYDYASSMGDIGYTTSTEDTPITLSLSSISTLKDVVDKNLQKMRPYDIMANRTARHVEAMEQNILLKGAYAIAPAASTSTAFILQATGPIVNGFRTLLIQDIITLRQAYLNANMNGQGGVMDGKPVLNLTPLHQSQLQAQDALLFKKFLEQDPSLPFDLFGFETYVSTASPRYNASTGAKVAFQAAALNTDTLASFSFLPGRVGRALGSVDMFLRNNDPDVQGHVFNFSQRFFVGQIDGTGVAAIYSPNS